MKDFDGWNHRKQKIDAYTKIQHPKEREIWWCSIGINVGTEVFGKGGDYSRPVLVINADGAENCIVLPISSKIKRRLYSCSVKTDDGKFHSVLVFQIKNIDKRRLITKKYTLAVSEYKRVREYFNMLFKI